ncbi:hypothetical protein TKK_0011157 [Trichogramma kaykai]
MEEEKEKKRKKEEENKKEERDKERARNDELGAKLKADEAQALARKKQGTLDNLISRTVTRMECPPDSPPVESVVTYTPITKNAERDTSDYTPAEEEAVLKAATNCYKAKNCVWTKNTRVPGYHRPWRNYRKKATRLLKQITVTTLMNKYGLGKSKAELLKEWTDNART